MISTGPRIAAPVVSGVILITTARRAWEEARRGRVVGRNAHGRRRFSPPRAPQCLPAWRPSDGRATLLPASAWNATGSANDACEASYGKADAWQCFFGQNVAKFIKTPMFVLNRWGCCDTLQNSILHRRRQKKK